MGDLCDEFSRFFSFHSRAVDVQLDEMAQSLSLADRAEAVVVHRSTAAHVQHTQTRTAAAQLGCDGGDEVVW